MKEVQALSGVKKFHELFGAYIGETPHMPPSQVCELRVNLLQEELDELKQAIADGDLIEVADALTDLQYVLSGAVISFGMQDIFPQLFDEVQRSNMSKACASLDIAEKTAAWYKEHKDMDSDILQKGEEYLVLRKGDQKALKSLEYSPANLANIIKNV